MLFWCCCWRSSSSPLWRSHNPTPVLPPAVEKRASAGRHNPHTTSPLAPPGPAPTVLRKVPDLDHPVRAAGEERAAVPGEGQRADHALVPQERVEVLPGFDLPDHHVAVRQPGRRKGAVARERDRIPLGAGAVERLHFA